MIKYNTIIIVTAIYLFILIAFFGVMIGDSRLRPISSDVSTIETLNTASADEINALLDKRQILPAPEETDLSSFTFGNPEPFK